MRAVNPLVIFSFLVFSCSQEKKTPPLTAEEIHKSVITIDTHDDINVGNFTDSLNYSTETQSQVHIPGMEAGGLDVAWFIVYTGQGDLTQEGYALAASNADDKFNAIHRLVS